MCGPRQLFFFQCGPETPKGWTPLHSILKGQPGPTQAVPKGSSTPPSVPAAHGHAPLEASAPWRRAPEKTK